MARTPLMDLLNRTLRDSQRTESASPADSRFMTRRTALTLGAAGLLLPLMGSRAYAQPTSMQLPALADSGRQARVVVVGAGVAGLHCAYRLQQAGAQVDVYEASERTGGRVFSARGIFAQDQVAELGGELINSDHVVMRGLAQEFGLALDDRHVLTSGLHAETIVVDGSPVHHDHLVEAWRPVARQMRRDVRRMSEAQLDTHSIASWLDSLDELDPVLRTVIELAYVAEFGAELGEQTLLNLRYLIDFSRGRHFRVLGDSDERYHTHAGNDAITTALTNALSAPVHHMHWLRRISQTAAEAYELEFESPSGMVTVAADVVVLAIPQTTMRDVELNISEFPELKRRSIHEVQYGRNSKLMSQYSRRVWAVDHQASGTTYVSGALGTGWDSTVGQSGDMGIWTNYVGGRLADLHNEGTPVEKWAGLVGQLELAYPGVSAAYTGQAIRFHWPTSPHQRGSWLVYGPGQMSEFWGCEGQPVGRLFFCGEHTSLEQQGYMEGAAESGLRAAREVRALLM